MAMEQSTNSHPSDDIKKPSTWIRRFFISEITKLTRYLPLSWTEAENTFNVYSVGQRMMSGFLFQDRVTLCVCRVPLVLMRALCNWVRCLLSTCWSVLTALGTVIHTNCWFFVSGLYPAMNGKSTFNLYLQYFVSKTHIFLCPKCYFQESS